MPSIIDTLIPHIPIDVVAIFDQNYNELFTQARNIKVGVNPPAKVMDHPLENGGFTTDHIVFLPIEIELSMIINSPDYADVYKSIKQYYLNAALLNVRTKVETYTNQLISAIPHEENPDQFDAIIVAMKLRQVQFVNNIFTIVPKDSSNSSTISRGIQQPTVSSTSHSTYALDIYNKYHGG